MSEVLFHHGKDHHMWTYCVHLGPWESPDHPLIDVWPEEDSPYYRGRKLDLGVYIDSRGSISLACVYGEGPHEYISGEIDGWLSGNPDREVCKIACEAVRRLGLHIAAFHRCHKRHVRSLNSLFGTEPSEE